MISDQLVLCNLSSSMKKSFPYDLVYSSYEMVIELPEGLTNRMVALGDMWIRDYFLSYNSQHFSFPLFKKQIALAYLESKFTFQACNSYIQGGQILKTDKMLFISSTRNKLSEKNKLDIEMGKKIAWPLEKSSKLEEGEYKTIDPLGEFVEIPALRSVPWSYHLDLLAKFVSPNLILLGTPFILEYYRGRYVNDELFKGLCTYKTIFESFGFEVVEVPLILPETNGITSTNPHKKSDIPFMSFVNAISFDKYFISSKFTKHQGEVEEEAISVLEDILTKQNLNLFWTELPDFLMNKGGFIHCLSNEFCS